MLHLPLTMICDFDIGEKQNQMILICLCRMYDLYCQNRFLINVDIETI